MASIRKDQADLEPRQTNLFSNLLFNVANDEQSYNEFVSQRINSSDADADDRIHFKIIHLISKAKRGQTFDATEELRDLNKNNGSR